jgi:hypothetical protein
VCEILDKIIEPSYNTSVATAKTGDKMTTTETTEITKHPIVDNDYYEHIGKLFGAHFTMTLEPHIYNGARTLSDDYCSGHWDFFSLSNGGFFMAPRSNKSFNVSCAYGEPVKMSAEGLGIAACLFAFSQLSFGCGAFAETCGRHYHLLSEFMIEHIDAPAILCSAD